MSKLAWAGACCAFFALPGLASAQGDPPPDADAAPQPQPQPPPEAAPPVRAEPERANAYPPAVGSAPDEYEEASATRDNVERVLTTTASDVPERFVLWRSDSGDEFIKPIVQMSTLMVLYVPTSNVNPDLTWRTSSLLLARLGFEGKLFEHLTFRTLFERNLGYTLARNGPVGTSVWEGTASLQARENYLRFSYEGFSITGGIFPDPASVDYISQNVLDGFGMDPYVRDPLLVTGFNQGQGFMLRYNWRWLTVGVSYTGGNPLTSSLAFGFGGDVSSLGTLFTAPLRALSNGIPGSDIHMNLINPSVTFETEYFDIKAGAQLYFVDVDVTTEDDVKLRGYNLRATWRLKLVDDDVQLFGTGAYRQNDQLNIREVEFLRCSPEDPRPPGECTPEGFEGMSFGGGLDVTFGFVGLDELSVGGMYYWIRSDLGTVGIVGDEPGMLDFVPNRLTSEYINIGLTWFPYPPNFSIGARWARSTAEATVSDARFKYTDSFILSMRLII